jgi:hypothetical protein
VRCRSACADLCNRRRTNRCCAQSNDRWSCGRGGRQRLCGSGRCKRQIMPTVCHAERTAKPVELLRHAHSVATPTDAWIARRQHRPIRRRRCCLQRRSPKRSVECRRICLQCRRRYGQRRRAVRLWAAPRWDGTGLRGLRWSEAGLRRTSLHFTRICRQTGRSTTVPTGFRKAAKARQADGDRSKCFDGDG